MDFHFISNWSQLKNFQKAMAGTEVTLGFKHSLTFGNVKAFEGS